MEGGNYLTAGEMALWGDHRHRRDGMAATGIGLAAGLGGGALLLAAAGIWGINQASKARSEGASKAIDILAQNAVQESARNQTISLDVNQTLRSLTGAAAQGGSATATAEALALLLNRNGGNGGQVCPQPVALYSPAKPCDC